jgi:hypothetical protein
MPSYCSRCGERVHGQAAHQPHLCRDLTKRQARQQKQVNKVFDLLVIEGGVVPETATTLAINIVGALNRLGITED